MIVIYIYGLIWVPILVMSIIDVISSDGFIIHPLTIYILLLSTLFFFLGAGISQICFRSSKQLVLEYKYKRSIYILYALIFLCFIGFIFSIKAWNDLGVSFLSFNAETYYKMNVIYSENGRVQTGFFGRLHVLSYVLIVYSLFLYNNKFITKNHLFFLCLLGLIFLFSPRRAILLYSIISIVIYFFAINFNSIKNKVPKFFIVSFLFVFIFSYTQFKLGKLQDFSIISSLQLFYSYFSSSIKVMDSLLYSEHFSNAWIVLSTPVRIISSIFFFDTNVDLSIPFVNVPEPSNTLPLPYYLYKSGGFLSVILGSAFIGFTSVYLCKRTKDKGSFLFFSLSIMFILGIMLSVREFLFITYDFFFWFCSIILIELLLKITRNTNE